MKTKDIEILEMELASAEWDLNYHTEKLRRAKILVDLCNAKIKELNNEC